MENKILKNRWQKTQHSKMRLFCLKFQITSGTKPGYRFSLFSKNNSKTFRALPNFLIHEFSKFSGEISISKYNEKMEKTKTNYESFNPFSPFFPTAIKHNSSRRISLDNIKVTLDKIIKHVKKIAIFSNICTDTT